MAKIFSTDEKSFSSASDFTYSVSDSIKLRINSDTKPQNMKTADLQKGVILLYKGTEVVGEGMGFGVPIAKYADETFFSGSSFLFFKKRENSVIIRKEFFMDMIVRDKFLNHKFENRKLRQTIDSISLAYQENKFVAKFILLLKQFLSKFGFESVFSKAQSKGKVVLTYTLDKNRIQVNVSLVELDRKNLEKVFVLNEQGAHFFGKYSDSDGLTLDNDEIGAWDPVTAHSAKISDKKDIVSFGLKKVEGTILRRGREVVKNSLDWIGLDYELKPERNQFEYEIEIFGDNK